MPDFSSLIAVALAFFVVTVSPGPANLAVATVAMSSGRRAGQLMGLGLSIGLSFWGIIAATGLGAVLQASEQLLIALKVLGGLYLLWLAFQSARSAVTTRHETNYVASHGRWFWRGLVLNLSNPKAVVAWMAALSMGLGTGDSGAELVTATLVCMILGFANYAGYALLFSRPGFMKGYRALRRWIDGLVAALFATAGLGLIRSALSR